MTIETTKPWQKGHPIEKLRRLSSPFRIAHKPHCYGAFELTKERDVASALEDGRYFCAYRNAPNPSCELRPEDETEEVSAACIARRIKGRPKFVRDFTGERRTVPEGAVYVSAFASLDIDSGLRLLATLREKWPDVAFYVETFVEDEVSSAAAESLGLAPLWHLVKAGSEIKCVWFPTTGLHRTRGTQLNRRVPGTCYDNLELATVAELVSDYLTQEGVQRIRSEMNAASDSFAQHYSSYNKRRSWTAFSLRGFSDDPSFVVKPTEMSRKWKDENKDMLEEKPRWTSCADLLPATREVALELAGSPESIDRLRFMRLSAKKGELSRHADITDREAGVGDGKIVRLHIPIETNEGVTVFGWDALGNMVQQKWHEGGLYYLDQRKPHRVVNEGWSDRTHLVLDMRINTFARILIGG